MNMRNIKSALSGLKTAGKAHISRIYPVAGLLLAAAGICYASAPHISDITTGPDGSRFYFTMHVDPRTAGLAVNSRVELTPVIYSESVGQRVELPPVVLAGRNMYYSTLRNGDPSQRQGLLRSGKDTPFDYTYSVPMEEWMSNCRVDMIAKGTGCCGETRGEDTEYQIAIISTRREFEPSFVYIAPTDTAEKRFDLSGRANIRFIVNKTNIDWSYANNYVELDSILRTVNAVKENPDATVESITLTGYASPEGPYDNNVRLAKGRTEVVKEYVRTNASFPADVYHTASVPEDWGGLREWLVNSSIENRDAMIAFIDDPKIPVRTKNDEFMRRFPNQYPFLLANVYPPLRHTDYRITYKVRKYLNVDEIREVFKVRPRNLSLNEFYLLANSYEVGSPEYDEVFTVAAQMYPTDPIANLNAANSAMNRGEWSLAERYLERDGDSAYGLYGRGLLLAMQKRYDEALPLFRKAQQEGVEQAADAIGEIEKIANVVNGVQYITRTIETLKQ